MGLWLVLMFQDLGSQVIGGTRQEFHLDAREGLLSQLLDDGASLSNDLSGFALVAQNADDNVAGRGASTQAGALTGDSDHEVGLRVRSHRGDSPIFDPSGLESSVRATNASQRTTQSLK
jgi:hypothetical protein